MIRMCGHTGEASHCSDLKASPAWLRSSPNTSTPCAGAWLTNGEDGGPGDSLSLTHDRNAIAMISKACRTVDELRRWCNVCHVGLWERDA
jgi:hypothetical protein